MLSKKFSLGSTVALAILTVMAMADTNAVAQTESVLHNFNPIGTSAAFPGSSLIFDAAGNLYGTSGSGSNTTCGTDGCGTAFELSPKVGGGWGVKVLHSFDNNGKDGYQTSAPLILDAAGNLYGTTVMGGSHGGGTVFELLPKTGGGWTERVLHNFSSSNTADGAFPYGGLILDAAGNLYGTTQGGGTYNDGTVFKLTPSGNSWTETVLYSFNPNNRGPYFPYAGLIFDSAGDLYGTTVGGGDGYGTVFELSSASGGAWTATVLHSFDPFGNDGSYPYGGLTLDAVGNLYGATLQGGNSGCNGFGCGTVFELTPSAGGTWTEAVLHSFGTGTDGQAPSAVTLTMDSSGNLYGTTSLGGSYSYGTAFELAPAAGGGWTETVLHSFGLGKDGRNPAAGLVFDAAGNLYGTAEQGGAGSGGAAFEIKL
jgi:uncharacterized repeat protein (TIGR03803 family)